MKAPTSAIRFNNVTNLFNYGFSNFEFVSLAKKGEIIQTVKVDKGTISSLNAVIESNVGSIISKGNDVNINKTINLPSSIAAPIKSGQKIGDVTFLLNDEIIGTANIISDTSIDKINLFTMTGNLIHYWFNLCR